MDAWEVLGASKAHKTTWQNGKYKARYDRIWSQGIRLNSFETFGQNKIPTINESSSDHRGLRLSFTL